MRSICVTRSDQRGQWDKIAGGPRGARTHNPRIKRPQDHDHYGLYLRPCPHRVPHQPHQPTTVDAISCHEPCHAASDRCGSSLLDGFAPAGQRGQASVERVPPSACRRGKRSRSPRSPAQRLPGRCAPPPRRLGHGGRPLRRADVRGAFGVGHLKLGSRSDRLQTSPMKHSGAAIRQTATTARGLRRRRKRVRATGPVPQRPVATIRSGAIQQRPQTEDISAPAPIPQ
jgi:hypothetical protein